MHNGVMIGSDCADWWERHIKDFKNDLGDYVETHPGYFSIVVATAGATLADLGDAFIVDPLRLGEGAAEGSWRGIVQDTFRVMSFIPPGRVFKLAAGIGKTTRALEAAESFRAVAGKTCVPIAIAQAIKTSGYKMAVGLVDVAKALGVDLKAIEELGTNAKLIEPALKKLGLVYETIEAGAKSFEELVAAARRTQSPMLVGLEAEAIEAGKVVTRGHRTLVVETREGVKIIDRYGVFGSIEELSRYYKRTFRIANRPLYVVKNALLDEKLLSKVNSLGILVCLARVSMAVLDFNHSKVPAEMVQKDFANFLKQRGKTPPYREKDVQIQGGKAIPVRNGDTLSGIAAAEYGSWELWPLIFDLNKDKIGKDPNRLQIGLRLLVLPLRTYTHAEIAASKRRAPSWKH